MEKPWLISAAFGGALLVAGLLMMRSHHRVWRAQKSDPELDAKDLLFFGRRYRRRMQASGMMALIGILLPIGDSVQLFLPAPGWFAVYWAIVLLLVMWLFVLAVSDMISTRAHSIIALHRLRAQQRELEREALALRRQLTPGRNGSGKPGTPETDA
ncbi:MAG: hypothetical protein AB7U20_12880 [Planctomycetaceae bacterium]